MLWGVLPVAVVIVALIGGYERARRRHRLDAARWAVSTRIGMALAGRFEEVNSVAEVLRLLVPDFADWCVLHLVEDQEVRRAAIVHVDPDMEVTLRQTLGRMPFVADAPSGPARVLRTGKPSMFRRFDPRVLDKQPDAAVLRAAGIGSSISVPLKARHDTVGVLTITRRAARAYDEHDLTWAQDLAHRLGLAVENRRLFGEARELFEQSASANFVSTPDGRMLACNQRFAELHGHDSVDSALSARPTAFYADPRDRQRLVDQLCTHARVSGFETSIVHRTGRLLPVSIDAFGTFDDHGALVKITGFVLDRTAQRELEEQLRQAQRLEAVGQLAGGIAHDFNNLLTVIIGCTDLLRSDHRAVVVDGHDPIEELAKAASRAAGLTQQLLAFSRRQVLQPRVVDLNAAVRHAHSMLRRLLRDNIVLVLDLDPRLQRVRVDPTQLDQVIMNLVVNAGDAMTTGGTLTVKTTNAVVAEDDFERRRDVVPGRYVCLTVSDTGVGMDEATCARVFEPFFTTKPIGKGTGLGLSTVYGIVKQSGGYIWLTSAPGIGTDVRVCLPPVEGDAPA